MTSIILFFSFPRPPHRFASISHIDKSINNAIALFFSLSRQAHRLAMMWGVVPIQCQDIAVKVHRVWAALIRYCRRPVQALAPVGIGHCSPAEPRSGQEYSPCLFHPLPLADGIAVALPSFCLSANRASFGLFPLIGQQQQAMPAVHRARRPFLVGIGSFKQ